MILRRDPCGLICAIFTYCAIAYADYALTWWMVMPTFGESMWGALHIVFFNTLLLLTIVSHGRTMLTDPGIVPISKNGTVRSGRPLNHSTSEDSDSGNEMMMLRHNTGGYVGEDWTVCTRCETFRPPRAHHCRVCRRCVRKMDHHCPWVNNCVGEFNQKFFLQFLMYVGMCSMYSFGVIILSWIYHDDYGSTGAKGPNGQNVHHTKVLHTIFLSMESALFGMFVCAVSCDQLQAIFNDETAVEAVQRRGRREYKRSRRKTKFMMLREVCGYGGLISWFLPCSGIPFERDVVSFPRESEHSHFDV